MMKKVTIVTPSEYEPIVIEELGRLKVIQLKEVSGEYVEELKRLEEEIDYASLYETYHQRYRELKEAMGVEVGAISPTEEELKRLTDDPKGEVERILRELSELKGKLTALEERHGEEHRSLEAEREKELEECRRRFQEEKESIEREIEKIESRFREASWNLSLVKLMEEVDIKESLAIGVVDEENLKQMEEYLGLYGDVTYKAFDISNGEKLLIVYGPAERRSWIEALFVVFKVRGLIEVLKERKLTSILDPEKRRERLERLEEEMKRLEEERAKIDELRGQLKGLEEEYKQRLEEIEGKYDEEMRRLEERHSKEREKLLSEIKDALKRAAFIDHALYILSLTHLQTLRTRVVTIIQGWLPEEYTKRFERGMKKLSEKLGGALHYEYAEASKDEVPPSKPRVPSILKPFYILTRMLGIPHPREINPTALFPILWIGMFGFMFPDIGQGLFITILGVLFAYVWKKRFMGMNFVKLGKLMIGLGLSATIFGLLFGDFFLVETRPLLFKPLHNVWVMIKLALFVGMAEILFALILGVINRLRRGEICEALMGDKGLGGLILFIGLLLMIFRFWSVRDFSAFKHWSTGIFAVGLGMIFMEPIVKARIHGEEGKLSELAFEGLGCVMESVISLLCNTLSFTRLAGFSLAHVALAEVVLSLREIGVGMGIFGLIFMNFLALSIEFLVVIIQSLRLLYYEFSTKFYYGDGKPFKPFSIITLQK